MARYRNAFILLALFVILLVVVLVTQSVGSNTAVTTLSTATPDPKAQQLQILNIPSANAPTRIEVKQTDPAKTVAFKYENSKWQTDTTPPQELDSFAVSNASGQLNALKGQALITDKGDRLADFGLDKPSIVINLSSPTLGTKTVNIGAQNPATKLYYVKLADDPRVWTVQTILLDQIKGWLDKLPTAEPTATPFPSVPLSPLPTLVVTGTPGTPGTGAAGTSAPAATTVPATTSAPAATGTVAPTTAAATTAAPSPSPTR